MGRYHITEQELFHDTDADLCSLSHDRRDPDAGENILA
jgi:hypothetical protein